MKPYEKYKNSGIEWLGEIPEHWSAIRIRRLTLVKRGASPRPIDDMAYFDENGEYGWVRIKDVTASVRYLEFTEERLSDLGSSKSVKLEPGNLFLSIAGSVGKPIINKIKCCIHDGFVYFPELDINVEYLYYIFSTAEIYNGLGKLGTQLNLNTDTVGGITIPIPSSVEEIENIVSYLDHQTAIIDELIAQKEQLITLLKQKRQAVINEAVTKGLNPNAKMKDSGIEWLGEVPESWKVVSLRYLGECQNGISKSGDFFGKGDPFISYSDVYKNDVLPSIVNGLVESTPEDKENFSVIEGDVFFTRTSETVEEIGYASVCLETIKNAVFAGFVIRFRLTKKDILLKEYARFLFRSFITRYHFVKEMNLVTRASLSQDLLKSLPITLPSIKVQKEIAEYLNGKTTSFDTIIELNNKAILKLKEYRQSLISEAVTGKIDLRDWQPNK